MAAPRVLPQNFGRGNSTIWRIGDFIDNTMARAFAVLRVAANVANGETVTISGDVFVVDVINTATGSLTTGGQLNNTTPTREVTITAHGLVAGDLIAVAGEVMLVTAVINANTVVVLRGYAGTTIAAHADGVAINRSATPGVVVAVKNHYPVGLTTLLTPVAFTAALTGTLRLHQVGNTSKQFTAVNPNANTVVVSATQRGIYSDAVAETLAGSGNAWDTATFVGGQPAERNRVFGGSHTVTAGDVTNASVLLALDLAALPSAYLVQLRTSAGVYKAWDGTVAFSAAPADPYADVPVVATFSIGTTSPFAATDVLEFIFIE